LRVRLGLLLLSAALLLDWRGQRDGNERLIEAAAAIAAAVDQVLGNAATRTRDIGGVAGTQVFGAAVCGVLRKE